MTEEHQGLMPGSSQHDLIGLGWTLNLRATDGNMRFMHRNGTGGAVSVLSQDVGVNCWLR